MCLNDAIGNALPRSKVIADDAKKTETIMSVNGVSSVFCRQPLHIALGAMLRSCLAEKGSCR